jgi:hypothetical protein
MSDEIIISAEQQKVIKEIEERLKMCHWIANSLRVTLVDFPHMP